MRRERKMKKTKYMAKGGKNTKYMAMGGKNTKMKAYAMGGGIRKARM